MSRSSHKNGPNSASNQSNAHCPTVPLVGPGAHHPLADQWPEGTKQPLTRQFAKAFTKIIASSTDSLFKILHDHPEFPPYSSLYFWKTKHPWFNQMWQQAREQQAETFVQKAIHVASNTTPQTAHVSRVQFDIYRWVAAKFAPALYGDKPANNQFQANVNLNVSLITNDKLIELRQRLTPTRVFIKEKSQPTRPAELTNGSVLDSRQQHGETQVHDSQNTRKEDV